MSFDGDLYPSSASVVMTQKGDMVDYNTARQRLGIGSTGQVLTVASSLPTWATLTTADSVLTTQGDVLYEGASGLARLGFGTSGDVLTTKGTGANPVWETPSAGGAWTLISSATSAGTTIDTTSLSACDDYEILDFWAVFDVDTGAVAEMQIYDSTDTLLTGSFYMNSGFAFGAFSDENLVDAYRLTLNNTTGTEDCFLHARFYNYDKGGVGVTGMGFANFEDRVEGGCGIGIAYKGSSNTIRGMKVISPTNIDNAYWYLLGA